MLTIVTGLCSNNALNKIFFHVRVNKKTLGLTPTIRHVDLCLTFVKKLPT